MDDMAWVLIIFFGLAIPVSFFKELKNQKKIWKFFYIVFLVLLIIVGLFYLKVFAALIGTLTALQGMGY